MFLTNSHRLNTLRVPRSNIAVQFRARNYITKVRDRQHQAVCSGARGARVEGGGLSAFRRVRGPSRTRTAPNSPCTSLRVTLPSLRRANLENSFYRHEGIHPEPEFRGRLHTTDFPLGAAEF